jgi:hypothetical protein
MLPVNKDRTPKKQTSLINRLNNFFGGIFRNSPEGLETCQENDSAPGSGPTQDDEEQLPGVEYQKGDVIGKKYEVYGVIGIGGFGVVYLVYSH